MRPSATQLRAFQTTVWDFYHNHKRPMPWRNTKNAYRILVSEIMLQQTQVEAVLKKYPPFIKLFPTLRALASAPLKDVLSAWQGLGYNRRAIALKKIAEIVLRDYRGKIPRDPAILETFPGIGHATARSFAAFAFQYGEPFIETNIRRVYIHHFFPRSKNISDDAIFPLVEKTIDPENPREWYWALMDYGSHLRKTIENPNRKSARYRPQATFAGSRREVRGQILRLLLQYSSLTPKKISGLLSKPTERIESVLAELVREQFVTIRRGRVTLSR